MIILSDVVKEYRTRSGSRRVLDHISLTIGRTEKVGLIGPNGAGKSTLMRIVSGSERPTSGSVERQMTVSWPLGFVGGFQSTLTGYDNLKFISRLYGSDYRKLYNYVQDFSELGEYLFEPVKTYSAGMRARLAFAISLGIDFECLIIDEVIAVGDQRFQEKSRSELLHRRKDRAMVIITHEMHFIRENCTCVYTINDGMVTRFEDIDEGIHYHQKLF